MKMERCYFKTIVTSESEEGEAFMKRFALDYQRCRHGCTGYFGYGTCEYYTSPKEVELGGLANIPVADNLKNE